jgi:hypothetical protein
MRLSARDLWRDGRELLRVHHESSCVSENREYACVLVRWVEKYVS